VTVTERSERARYVHPVSTLRESPVGSSPPGKHVRSSGSGWRERSAARRSIAPPLLAPVIALVAGVVTGCLVLFMHESGSALRVGGDLGGPWLIAAFAAGSISKNRALAAVTGFATLLAMLLGYYWIGNLDGSAEIAHTFRFWLAVSLVAGPVMGWAGWSWLGATALERVAGISILAGCLIAEGIFFWSYGHRTVPVVEVAIGVAAAFLLPRSGRERGLTVLGTATVTAVASVSSRCFKPPTPGCSRRSSEPAGTPLRQLRPRVGATWPAAPSRSGHPRSHDLHEPPGSTRGTRPAPGTLGRWPSRPLHGRPSPAASRSSSARRSTRSPHLGMLRAAASHSSTCRARSRPEGLPSHIGPHGPFTLSFVSGAEGDSRRE